MRSSDNGIDIFRIQPRFVIRVPNVLCLKKQPLGKVMKTKIGFLPLYLKLYDDCVPEKRAEMKNFLQGVICEFRRRGIAVASSDLCRVAEEFKNAVKFFESEKVDAIVTLHLAYSPSMECIDALAGTEIPLVVLNTTPDFDFGARQKPDKIMFNHGIHGVQDMCNMLIRNRKRFLIVAGHWKESDVLDRACDAIQSAKMANSMRNCRVGIFGHPFDGMGDFALPFSKMKKLIGIKAVSADSGKLRSYLPVVDSSEVISEIKYLQNHFPCRLDDKILSRSVQAGLAIRRWINEEKLDAYTLNFMCVNKESALPTVPFIETCMAMSRGIGFAGEGDVLTAALSGAVAKTFPQSTFVEMFCPDWKNNSIFMSHMGEVNSSLIDDPCITEYEFPYTDAENPAKLSGRLKPGNAIVLNLAPSIEDKFNFIIAPVEVKKINEDKMEGCIRAWIKPQRKLSDFLEQFSRAGGTHHSVMAYSKNVKIFTDFAELMGWNNMTI